MGERRKPRVSTVEGLLHEGLVEEDQRTDLELVAAKYSVSVSPAMLAVIEHNPDGAVAKQFVPTLEELHIHPSELVDPIGDDRHSPVKGVTHRYPDRALLFPLLICPVYCRFCFRREVVGGDEQLLGMADLDKAINYIQRNESIWEVVLTGGDPGILPISRLEYIVDRLDSIPHVGNIRIHTRVPVVEPNRITDRFVAAIDRNTAVWVAIHINSADELTGPATEAVSRLSRSGIPMLGQTVLLRGINDSAAQLESLFRAMVSSRIKPYYLHQLDLAKGTQHFRVPISEGRQIMRSLRGNISGVAMPTYVLDVPGGLGKTPLESEWLNDDGGTWVGTSSLGHDVTYEEPL